MRPAALIPIAFLAAAAAAAPVPPAHAEAARKARDWMDAARRPNGLLDSQADGAEICYTYDQAVAAAAYLALGDTAKARALLSVLESLQDTSGLWRTAYDGRGAVVGRDAWVGPVFWAALASARYRKATGSARFDAMSRKALLWCLRFRQGDGSIRGGLDAAGAPLTYTSVEENQDGYAAFKAFGMDPEAAAVRSWLVAKAWDASRSRWRVGPGRDEDFLDVNSWGWQSLGPEGPADNAKGLDYNLARMRLKKTAGTVTVDGFDFNGDKDDVWLEGTAQMAAALKSAGRGAEADYFLDEVIKAQQAGGGIPYSLAGGTTGDGWNMPKVAAVSSAGWFILAAYGINPFHADRDVPVTLLQPRRTAAIRSLALRAPAGRDILGRLFPPAAIPSGEAGGPARSR